MAILGSNPIVNGQFGASHRLRRPVEFGLPSGSVTADQVDYAFTISGQWFSQVVALDATAGLYDWLRRRFRVAPGPGQVHIKDVDFDKGAPIDRPPESELTATVAERGEIWMNLLVIEGLTLQKPVPRLEDLIVEAPHARIPDLPASAFTSNGAGR